LFYHTSSAALERFCVRKKRNFLKRKPQPLRGSGNQKHLKSDFCKKIKLLEKKKVFLAIKKQNRLPAKAQIKRTENKKRKNRPWKQQSLKHGPLKIINNKKIT